MWRHRLVGTMLCFSLLLFLPAVVVAAPLAFTGGSLAPAVRTVSTTRTVAATGGTAPYGYHLTSGSLPPGMNLNSSTGAISGSPSINSTYSFTIQVVDASASTASASFSFWINNLSMASLRPNAGRVGYPYVQDSNVHPVATAGVAPYTYILSLTNGSTMPPGLSFSSSTRQWTGVPTAISHTQYTMNSVDSVGITFSPPSVLRTYNGAAGLFIFRFDDYSLHAVQGRSFSQSLTAAGMAAGATYSLKSGILPAGLSYSSTGLLSGTPTVSGSFTFQIRATDTAANSGKTVDATITVVVSNALSLVGSTLAYASIGAAYSQTLPAASGGVPGYSYAITAGALPAGLAFDAATRTISGTSSVTGSFSISITATDAGPPSGSTVTATYALVVSPPALILTGSSLPGAALGTAYSYTIAAASGGVPGYNYAITAGALPAGLAFDAATRTISGTSSVTGSFSISITATDAGPPNGSTVTATYALVVSPPALILTGSSLPGAALGTAYSYTIAPASGGVPGYSYALTAGALPAGLAFDAATRTISGTSSVTGPFSISITATDAGPPNGSTVTATYALVVSPPALILTGSSLPGAALGTAYSYTIAPASGGVPGYSYAITAGALPAGLAFDAATRTISGTSSVTGSFSISITATDAAAPSAGTVSAVFTLTVGAGNTATAVNQVVEVLGPVTVDITAGATNGPFTQATIISIAPPTSGRMQIILGRTASLSPDEMLRGHFYLDFAPAPGFFSAAVVTFTISNSAGTSASSTVTFNVRKLPDPTADPDVVGLLNAHRRSAERFAKSQTENINRRLEQLHDPHCHKDQLDVRFKVQAGNEEADIPWMPTAPAATDFEDGKQGRVRLSERFGGDLQSAGETGGRAKTGLCSSDAVAIWSGGLVDIGRSDMSGADIFDYTSVGVSGGLDYRLSESLSTGVAIGFNTDRSDVDLGSTRSTAQGITAAAYASYHPVPDAFIDGLGGINVMTFDSQRQIGAAEGIMMARSQREGRQVFASLTAGYEYRQNGMMLSPYARLTGAYTELDAFTEDNVGIDQLGFGRQTFANVTSFAGLRATYSIPFTGGVLTPGVRIEWARDFTSGGKSALHYINWNPDIDFVLQTESSYEDTIPLSLEGELEMGDHVSVSIAYNTTLHLADERMNTYRLNLSHQF